MGLREEKKRLLREDILETAIALFHERGFDRARVRDICERVRCSEATFFNYFPSKEAVLDAYSLQLTDGYEALLTHMLHRDDLSAADRIREIIRTAVATFTSDRAFMTDLVLRSQIFYGAKGEIAERQLRNYELFAELIRTGQRSGEFRRDLDPVLVVETLNGAFMFVLVNWMVGWWPGDPPVEPRVEAAVEMVLGGALSRRTLRRARSRP